MIEELEKKYFEFFNKDYLTNEEAKEHERLRLLLDAELNKECQLLYNQLRDIGVLTNDIWDFVNTSESYPEAIPLLIKHLEKPYHKRNKEGIVRALAVKEAKGIACQAIINEYNRSDKSDFHYCWTFGNTMNVVINKDYLDQVISIVENPENGESREMFVMALGKFKNNKVREVLFKLLNDKDELVRKAAEKKYRKFKNQ